MSEQTERYKIAAKVTDLCRDAYGVPEFDAFKIADFIQKLVLEARIDELQWVNRNLPMVKNEGTCEKISDLQSQLDALNREG